MQGERNTQVPQGRKRSPKKQANSGNQQNNETTVKKRRRRQKKKKTGDQQQKTENLISKTYQAKLQNNLNTANSIETHSTNSCENNLVLHEQSINLEGKSDIITNMNEVNGKNTPVNNNSRTQGKNQNKIPPKPVKQQRSTSASVNPGTKVEKGNKETLPLKQKTKETTQPSKTVNRKTVAEAAKGSSSSSTESTSRSDISLGEENCDKSNEKTREQILSEREAKKLAKQATKGKAKNKTNNKDRGKVESNDLFEVKSQEKQYNNQDSKTCDNLEGNKIETKDIKAEKFTLPSDNSIPQSSIEKSREQILAEREARKLAKQAAKNKAKDKEIVVDQVKKESDETPPSVKPQKDQSIQKNHISSEIVPNHVSEKEISGVVEEKKKPTTKAERRALQEAQRQAKAQVLAEKQQKQKSNQPSTNEVPLKEKIPSESHKTEKSSTIPSKRLRQHKIKLFNHLETTISEQNLFINNQQIHPAMVRLGEQYAKRTVVGSNARCIAFLNALKRVIEDYETPPKKEFARSLETSIKSCVDHLHNCRPLAVSVHNAHKYVKVVLTQLPADKPESNLKEELVKHIDTYIKDQIEKAAQAISSYVGEKISDGDVILTFGCSSLIYHILEEARRKAVNFRVIIVDSRPFLEGHELLRRLVTKGIPCTCVLINAIGFIMPEVTKVLLGAHALLANGYVMSRTGTAQIALVARSFNVPVLVCCETHKFSERVQTDAIVYNELGNPDDLILKPASKENRLADWRSYSSLHPLNLNYDVTPPELVTAVVTEVAILPCTSVPVILRIKPAEIGY